jgi:uncharacterized protein (DUF2237 family)
MDIDLNLYYKALQPCNYDDNVKCIYYFTESGTNIVCIIVTNEFLNFSKKRGYDLNKFYFDNNNKIIKEGDRCCLCIYKWVEAYNAGMAPQIVPESTSIEILKHVPIEILKNYII